MQIENDNKYVVALRLITSVHDSENSSLSAWLHTIARRVSM